MLLNRAAHVVELLAPLLAHRVHPFELGKLHLGHRVFFIGHGRMGLAAILGHDRIDDRFLRHGMAGEFLRQRAHGLAAPGGVMGGAGLVEQTLAPLVLLHDHRQPVFTRGKPLDLAPGLGALIGGRGGGHGGGDLVEK